jgi:hypothetical protein
MAKKYINTGDFYFGDQYIGKGTLEIDVAEPKCKELQPGLYEVTYEFNWHSSPQWQTDAQRMIADLPHVRLNRMAKRRLGKMHARFCAAMNRIKERWDA